VNAQVDPNGPKLTSIASNPVPEGARVGYFTTSDKVRLRYALWPKSKGAPKGTVCLVQGRTEYIEKYFETIEDFRQRGFAVATFDWRGQGGSDRLIGDKHLGYVDRFDDYTPMCCCLIVHCLFISSAIPWAGWQVCMRRRATG
jgi:lysophospholipase